MVTYQPANTAEFDNVRIYRYSAFAFAKTGLTLAQLLDYNVQNLLGFTNPAGVKFQVPNQADYNQRSFRVQFKARGEAVINNTVSGALASVPAPITSFNNGEINFDGSGVAIGIKPEDDSIYTDQPLRNVNVPSLNAIFQLQAGAIFLPTVIMPAAAGHILSITLFMTIYSIKKSAVPVI